jgi:hypothetical protein
MEGQEMAYATLRECSIGQPKYHIEVYYDGGGECYFCDGWPKFFIDYSVHAGSFLLFTRRDGEQNFIVCIFDGTRCARTFTPGREGKRLAALSPTRISSTLGADFYGTKSMRCSRYLVDLQRGLLRDEVHAALTLSRGRRVSPWLEELVS